MYKSTKANVSSPWKRVGGKSKICDWIKRNLPPHETYVEVFGGSAPVLLTKTRARVAEVYNDLDGLWVNSLTMARDRGRALAELIAATPYSREEFERAAVLVREWGLGQRAIEPIELARLHLIVVRQSFSATGRTWSTWSKGNENRADLWARMPNAIASAFTRLRGVFIEKEDYSKILQRYDSDRTTFYLDPPYFGVETDYYDVNKQIGFDHDALRAAVETVKGSVVISYYGSPEMDKLYAGWRREEKQVKTAMGQAKNPKTEVLFIRPSVFGRRKQLRLRQIFPLENDLQPVEIDLMPTGSLANEEQVAVA